MRNEIAIGNPDGFAKAIAGFAEPLVLVSLAAKVLETQDIKKDSGLAKEIILFGQAQKEKAK